MENKKLLKLEGNLAEYPFFSYRRGYKREITQKAYKIGEINLPDGRKEVREFTVAAPMGMPTAYYQDVLMGILRIGTRDKNLTDKIYFTLYEVAEIIGSKRHEKKIKQSLIRLLATTYFAKNTVIVKGEKSEDKLKTVWEKGFHIFDEFEYLGGSETNKRLSRGNTYVKFNSFFVENFINQYYKYIDYDKYKEIETPLAKKIYLYLEKKRFEKSSYEINIEKLARVIPVEAKTKTEIRRRLKETGESLINKNIIKNYKTIKDNIIYYFGKQIKEDLAVKNKEERLIDQLTERGVTKATAVKMVDEYERNDIEKQIEFIKHRKVNNKTGALVKAIKENWAPPKEYTVIKQKEETTKQNEITRKQEEERAEKIKKYEETIQNIFIELTKEEQNLYEKKAEEEYQKEFPRTDLKYFIKPLKDSYIRKFIAQDKGIPTP